MSFWESLWLVIYGFFFIMYLIVMFQIVVDIFRDSGLKGWAKALWILALLVVPVLSALIYLIARGGGMNKRQYAAVEQSREATEEYIRSVAGNDPAKQIADAKALLDSGAITADEFAQLKAKALA
ncbi:SHOCT domain-containing protein [Tessaracoccus palaemonis]|uniref:SHOCT domain-containing protein n=1 Tax=Tessaracoccus palaemonis TaxID=2829499 RepID=A0ABX8SJ42_9ACTN|nr:SHOCT domain-containing protein [Tessaracoccus palaemonis]QXT62477.1 SHOCT domain-containing protein [Tessaracoccus palaemonis]